MKYVFLSILLFQVIGSAAQIKEAAEIDEVFSQWDNDKSPGCTVAIIKDHKIMYSKGYGMANLEYGIPNGVNSVYRIASTSKQFTAACIVLLSQEGKLSLDDNLRSIFPEFPEYADKITIKHLLNHTSGIRDYLQLAYLKGLGDDDYYSDNELMTWLINQTDLNFNPGEEELYSNSGYWLLGQIVNHVSGMDMAEYAEKKLFKPLGMGNTHFHNDHNLIVPNRASGYTPTGEDSFRISMTTLEMIGDGGIFTTINDIKKWDDAFYKSDVLDQEFWRLMTVKGLLNNGEHIDYASGLMIEDYKGFKTVRHGGSFVGYNAEVLRFPDQKMSIIIFANTGNFYAASFANQVADILLKDVLGSEEENIVEGEVNTTFINLGSKEVEKFCGNYWNEASSYKRRIYMKNDTLHYYRNEYSETKLLPISNNEFKMLNVPSDVIVEFVGVDDYTMNVFSEGDKIATLNSFNPKSHSKEELSLYVGDYYSDELDVTYRIVLDEDNLMIFIKESNQSPLTSVMQNLFSCDAFGVFKFEEDADGSIGGFKLASGRVKNLRFEKKNR